MTWAAELLITSESIVESVVAQKQQIEVVLLRGIRYREADTIVHGYSAELGRVHALARGSRKPKSKFAGRLEPGTVSNLEVVQGRGELLTVTGAATVVAAHRTFSSRAGLQLLSEAVTIAEKVCIDEQPNPLLYGLLKSLILAIESDPDQADASLIASFEWKLLIALGIQPALNVCVLCEATDGLIGVDPSHGGAVCRNCEGNKILLSPDDFELIHAMLATPMLSRPAMGAVEASKLRDIAERFRQSHL